MDHSSTKKPKMMPSRASRVRCTIQLEVESGMEGRLERLKYRIQRAKSAFGITSRTPSGNVMMLERLLNCLEEREYGHSGCQSTMFPGGSLQSELSLSSPQKRDACSQTDICKPYVLAREENTTGNFDIHSASQPVEKYFISSFDATERLVQTMVHYGGKCPLCGYHLDMTSFTVHQHGHAVRVSINCVAGHSLRWFSSGIIGGKFTANLR